MYGSDPPVRLIRKTQCTGIFFFRIVRKAKANRCRWQRGSDALTHSTMRRAVRLLSVFRKPWSYQSVSFSDDKRLRGGQ